MRSVCFVHVKCCDIGNYLAYYHLHLKNELLNCLKFIHIFRDARSHSQSRLSSICDVPPQPLHDAHDHITLYGKFASGVDCRATGGATDIEGHRGAFGGAESEGRGVLGEGHWRGKNEHSCETTQHHGTRDRG